MFLSLWVFFSSFDFCTAAEENSPAENLGQVVFGERIRPSPYKIEFGKNTDCQVGPLPGWPSRTILVDPVPVIPNTAAPVSDSWLRSK